MRSMWSPNWSGGGPPAGRGSAKADPYVNGREGVPPPPASPRLVHLGGYHARAHRPPTHPARRRGGPMIAPSASDVWFAGHTFDAEEFGDLDALLALKRARGVTISLGLPALNEQPTIGREIQILRRALIDEVPFLDEIVVIDSGSVDGTAEV